MEVVILACVEGHLLSSWDIERDIRSTIIIVIMAVVVTIAVPVVIIGVVVVFRPVPWEELHVMWIRCSIVQVYIVVVMFLMIVAIASTISIPVSSLDLDEEQLILE